MANPLFQTAPLQHAALSVNQLYFRLYLEQAFEGPRQNQNIMVESSLPNCFGLTAVNDWPIYDGQDRNSAKIIARARGHHFQSGKDEGGHWFHICNIVFVESWYAGSTLVVIGTAGDKDSPSGEWAIVGGTGKFTLAQGVIYFNKVETDRTGEVFKELHIHALYTPMETSLLQKKDEHEKTRAAFEIKKKEVDEEKQWRKQADLNSTLYERTIRGKEKEDEVLNNPYDKVLRDIEDLKMDIKAQKEELDTMKTSISNSCVNFITSIFRR